MYSETYEILHYEEPMLTRVWNSIKDTCSSIWGFCTGREDKYDGRPIIDQVNPMVF